jgi:hypothetical protein
VPHTQTLPIAAFRCQSLLAVCAEHALLYCRAACCCACMLDRTRTQCVLACTGPVPLLHGFRLLRVECAGAAHDGPDGLMLLAEARNR